MPRQIKFRTRIDAKWYIQEYCGGFCYFIHSESDALSLEDVFVLVERGGCVIQQFTGLLDKVGKEIFEGDIILYRKTHREVRFGEFWNGADDYYGFFLQDSKVKHRNFGTANKLAFTSSEIIGNIFENSDLLVG